MPQIIYDYPFNPKGISCAYFSIARAKDFFRLHEPDYYQEDHAGKVEVFKDNVKIGSVYCYQSGKVKIYVH